MHLGSEIAQLKQNIEQEYQAAQRGLTDLAFGAARHDFIIIHMQNMGQYCQQLEVVAGETATQQFLTELGGVS
jgi:hypothetical protein